MADQQWWNATAKAYPSTVLLLLNCTLDIFRLILLKISLYFLPQVLNAALYKFGFFYVHFNKKRQILCPPPLIRIIFQRGERRESVITPQLLVTRGDTGTLDVLFAPRQNKLHKAAEVFKWPLFQFCNDKARKRAVVY